MRPTVRTVAHFDSCAGPIDDAAHDVALGDDADQPVAREHRHDAHVMVVVTVRPASATVTSRCTSKLDPRPPGFLTLPAVTPLPAATVTRPLALLEELS